VAIPNVVGLTVKEAKIVLQKNKFEIAAIIYDEQSNNVDTLFVYKQNPPSVNEKGDSNFLKKNNNLIDIWVGNLYNSADSLKKPKQRVAFRIKSNE
jgi:hypothetical protein